MFGFEKPPRGGEEGPLRPYSTNQPFTSCNESLIVTDSKSVDRARPMPGIDILIGALDAHDCDPREYRGQWTAKCPLMHSTGRKLGVKADGDRVLFQCFAGCDKEDILGALGLEWRDLFDRSNRPVERRREPWERHLDKAVRSGAKPVRIADGVYQGLCTCGGQLYVGRAGAACDRGCRISLDPVPPRFIDPVSLAESFGADLRYSGDGVFVGTCPSCKGWLSAGPGGACCESNCPIEEVGFQVRSLRDQPKGRAMQKRVLEVLGCVEKKRGEKNGRVWTLYAVHANDENGQPIQHELTSFDELPQGRGEYYVTAKESQYGTQYTVKRNISVQEQHNAKVEAMLAEILSHVKGSPVPPATAAAITGMNAPGPANVTQIAPVEVGEVPF